MAVCVECGSPQKSLFTVYGKDNAVLDKCSACGQVADSYLELDETFKFIEMILIKPAIYRHLLLNIPERTWHTQMQWVIASVVLDIFVAWNAGIFTGHHFWTRYLLLVCYIVLRSTIYLTCLMVCLSPTLRLKTIISAWLWGSVMKLFHIVLFVWDYYRDIGFSTMLSIAVLVAQVEAFSVLLAGTAASKRPYWHAGAAVAFASLVTIAVDHALSPLIGASSHFRL